MSNQQWSEYAPPSGTQRGSNYQQRSCPGEGGPSERPPPAPFLPVRPPFPPQQRQQHSQPLLPPPLYSFPASHSNHRPYIAPRPPFSVYQSDPPPPPSLPRLSPPFTSPSPTSQPHSPAYPRPQHPYPSSSSTPTQGLGALPPKPGSSLPPTTLNSNGKRPVEPVAGQASAPPRPPPAQRRRWDYKLPAQLPPPIPIVFSGEEIISELPPIPPLNEPLFSQVFTHTSLKGTVKQVFEEPDSTGAICDYERLEHLGDSVLGFIATELIQDLFPRLTVGCASELRSNLVNNTTALPSYATAYHLHTRLRASQSQLLILMAQKGTRSQLFEAYLAGIFRQYGYPLLRTWLRDILTPVAHLAHASLKKQKLASPISTLGPVASDVGFTALLNQWGYDARHKIEYVDSSELVVRGPTQKHKLYEFSVRVSKRQQGEKTMLQGPSLVVESAGARNSKSIEAEVPDGGAGSTEAVEQGEEPNGKPWDEEEVEVAELLVVGGGESTKEDVEEEWLIFGPSQASKKAAAKNNCAWAACIALGIVAKTT